MRLEQLDPVTAATLRQSVAPKADDWSEAQLRSFEAEQTRLRHDSLRKGMAQSAAIYERQRVRRMMVENHLKDISNIGAKGDD